MTDRPQVWVVSPAWQRFAVTRLALTQRRRLCDELAARGLDAHMVIVADDENLDVAREHGAHAVEAPNLPVSRKFNLGLRYAGDQGADYVVWVGSDDWIHADLFGPLHDEPYTLAAKFARPIITGRKIAIVDLEQGRLRHCVAAGRTGVIPWIIPADLLAKADWQPLRPDRSRGLDGWLVRGLRDHRAKPAWKFYDPHPLARVDFKSSVNLNPYERLARGIGRGRDDLDPWATLAERYPADLVDLARRTHQEMAG